MGAQYRKIVRSRKLAERSYLYFKYPSKDKSLEFYLPFMENIDIGESQRPNYATYDLIGRAGSLYAYLGTKSREMTLKFNITLPNIVDYIHNVGLSEMFADNFREVVMGINKSEERKKFFTGKSTTPLTPTTTYSMQGKFDYYREGKKDIQQVDASFMDATDRKSGTRSAFEDIAKFFSKSWGLGDLLGQPEVKKGFSDVDTGTAVNYLMMWVNVIRTSVINNSKETQYGPPMVYLNHGTMYNNIPCVCTNYSIKIQNNAGYELLSLAPRQVEITMNLSETRVGDFDTFKPFDLVKGENLTGWEAVINDKGTMDPNNQFLRLYRHDSQELKAVEDLIEKNSLAQSSDGPLGTGFAQDYANPTPVFEGYGVLAPTPTGQLPNQGRNFVATPTDIF